MARKEDCQTSTVDGAAGRIIMDEIDEKIIKLQNKRSHLRFEASELDTQLRIAHTKIYSVNEFIDDLNDLKSKLNKDEKNT